MPITPADMEAVRNLVARIKLRSDDRDLDGVRACWAANARLEVRYGANEPATIEGRDQILQSTTNNWAHGHVEHPHVHMVGTVEITDRGDGSLGADSYCAYVSSKGDFAIVGYGRYKDIVVREDGAWRFKIRSVQVNLSF